MSIYAWTFQICQMSYTENVVKVHALEMAKSFTTRARG